MPSLRIISEDTFNEAIDDQIRNRCDSDAQFVETLRNYVKGLVEKRQTDPQDLQVNLEEFLEGHTKAFVQWLTDFISRHHVTAGEGPGLSRERPVAPPQRLQSTVAVAQRRRTAQADEVVARGTARDRLREAGRASRPAGNKSGPAPTSRARSRSPHSGRAAQRSGTSKPTRALLDEALRRATDAGGAAVAPQPIKAEAEAEVQVVRVVHAAPSAAEQRGSAGAGHAAGPGPGPARLRLGPHPFPPQAFGAQSAAQGRGSAVNGALHPGVAAAFGGLPWRPGTLDGADAGGESVDPMSVVIQNVHFEATPEGVGLFFEDRVGDVVRVTILKNAFGMSKGYAYMQLASATAAQQALALSGTEFMGRHVKVVQKHRKPPPSAAMRAAMLQQMLVYAGLAMGAPAPFDNQRWQTGAGGWGFGGGAPYKRNPGHSHGARKGRSDVWLRGQD